MHFRPHQPFFTFEDFFCTQAYLFSWLAMVKLFTSFDFTDTMERSNLCQGAGLGLRANPSPILSNLFQGHVVIMPHAVKQHYRYHSDLWTITTFIANANYLSKP